MEKIEIKVDPKKLKPLISGNKVFRSVYDYELSLADVERARLELNETEEVRRKSLHTLKEMLSRDGIKYRTDDAYLLTFLRCRKFRCVDAYKMMREFYSLKKRYPETFCALPANLRTVLDNNFVSVLPYRDEDGSVLFLDTYAKWDASKLSIFDLLQYFQPIASVIVMNPACQINKIALIIDCAGMNFRHLAAVLNPKSLRLWLDVMENLYAWRIKHVILVNCNRYVHLLLKGCRHVMKKKLADRIVIIGSDMSEMHEYHDPAILPKKYGGTLDESECTLTDHIINNLHYVKYDLSFP